MALIISVGSVALAMIIIVIAYLHNNFSKNAERFQRSMLSMLLGVSLLLFAIFVQIASASNL